MSTPCSPERRRNGDSDAPFRITALATITAIISQAMGGLTINLSVGGVFTEDILYAHLAVAGGVSTILSLPMMCVYLALFYYCAAQA